MHHMQYRMAQEAAGPGAKFEGVLLTHLHMGHYIGLFSFGREALNVTGLKVWCKFAPVSGIEYLLLLHSMQPSQL